ncbi:hypothetical protein AtubIFM61612_000539 [Aspergillus tubingensis]|nr:hypothetical protein AtubIFM57143_002617 [Aspergillus tubingensis]GLB13135.1 hypothetical protein AtubIFM61612_000539 [Aspergillus tubingensis]
MWFGQPCLKLPLKHIKGVDSPLEEPDYQLLGELRKERMQLFKKDALEVRSKAVLKAKLAK